MPGRKSPVTKPWGLYRKVNDVLMSFTGQQGDVLMSPALRYAPF